MSEVNHKLISPAVEDHLTTLLEHLNVTDYSIDITPGTVIGDNFLGIIANVKIVGKNKNGTKKTLNLIVKSAPCNEIFRKHFPIHAAYERETYIYKKVLPEFIKLQEEKHISKPFTSFAKFFSSTLEDLDEAIVMENMKQHGFKLWNRHEPIDYHHALLVMKNYGKLHAFSFAIRDQKPELFKELSANTQEVIMIEENCTPEQVEHLQGQIGNAFGALDPIEHKEAYERLLKFQEHVMRKTYTALKSEEAEPYAVIGHGDCWINNILFKYDVVPLFAESLILFTSNNVWSQELPKKHKCWLHSIIAFIATALITTGVALEVERKTHYPEMTHFSSVHAIAGLIAVAVIIVSLISGSIAFTTSICNRYQSSIICKLVHNILGQIGYSLAIISLILGIWTPWFEFYTTLKSRIAITVATVVIALWSLILAGKSLYVHIVTLRS